MTPYRNRTIDPTKPVEVYRCLPRNGRVFSIRQGGLVVAHAEEVYLCDCEFIVQKGRRSRAAAKGIGNERAVVRGMLHDNLLRFGNDCKHRFKYTEEHGFEVEGLGPVSRAKFVKLCEDEDYLMRASS